VRDRDTYADRTAGYALVAATFVFACVVWYFITMGVIVVAKKAACKWQNIGQTCIVVVAPEEVQ
jgi:hypothetical protein